MVTPATNIPMPMTQATFGLRARLAQWVGAFCQAIENKLKSVNSATNIRLLEAKRDAELAGMGLNREEITPCGRCITSNPTFPK